MFFSKPSNPESSNNNTDIENNIINAIKSDPIYTESRKPHALNDYQISFDKESNKFNIFKIDTISAESIPFTVYRDTKLAYSLEVNGAELNLYNTKNEKIGFANLQGILTNNTLNELAKITGDQSFIPRQVATMSH